MRSSQQQHSQLSLITLTQLCHIDFHRYSNAKINKESQNIKRNSNSLNPQMSSNQILLQGQSVPASLNQISSNHNITLGAEQTDHINPPHNNCMPSFSQNYAIQFELKNISREVSKMTQKGRNLTQNQPMTASLPLYQNRFNTNQIQKDFSTMLNLKKNISHLSKYNYYGRQYRFQIENPSQGSQKPMEVNPSHQEQEHRSFSPTTKHIPKRQELNIPDSQSYFIYFEQPKNQKEFKHKFNKAQSHHQMIQDTNNKSAKKKQTLFGSLNLGKIANKSIFQSRDDDEVSTPPLHMFSKQQPQSKWVLEKKVKRLEKELNMLKKKQDQRERMKNFTVNNSKKDSKVFVGKQVDQLINSLWP